MNNKIRILITALFLVNGLFAKGQGYTSKQIDSIVHFAMDKMTHAGMAVLVVKDGEVVHSKGYGICDIESKKKVDANTRFAIASNSKAFTSAALAILVDDGRIEWSDKVVDIIPEFKMYNPYVTANFTITDLLTHRSGLGLGAGDLMFFPDGGDFTMTDILKSFQYQKVESDFRTKFDYDNLLYVVAGEVVARVSGKTWSEFVEQRIMVPLGMNNSATTHQRLTDKKNVALPHSFIEGELTSLEAMDIDLGAAAGGIYTSVSDLSNWLLMHLDDGKWGDTTLISSKNHSEMWKPHTNMGFTVKGSPNYNSHFKAYGLGWRIGDKANLIEVSHTGGLPGMLSKTTLIPEIDLGVVVLTNAFPGGYSYQTISNLIIDSYLGIERDWIQSAYDATERNTTEANEVVEKVWQTVDTADASHLDFASFVGTYRDNWFGDIEVSQTDEGLYMKCLRSPKLSGPMAFYKGNTFAIKWDYKEMECDAFAIFSLNAEGIPNGFTMEGISPSIDFSFDFHDLNLHRVE
jgi:CubicO group peptidase (beta-lactamase class C family)